MDTNYRACIFDLDGTLANTLYSIAYFGNTALQSFGLPPIEAETYKTLVGNGADVLLRRMLQKVGATFSEEEFRSLRKEYDRLYESDPMKLVTSYEGLTELLARLKKEGLLLGVLSNKPDNMTRYVAESLYPDTFHHIQGQQENVPKKPDPTAALSIAKEFHLSPREILYVGDSGVDMQTGNNAGMDPCGVLWGFRGKQELLENGAKHLAETAGELEEIIFSLSQKKEE